MKNFWQSFFATLPAGRQEATKGEKNNKNKPIYTLAPMADITDSAFRQMCLKSGADVLYSEMASATALNFSPEKTLELLKKTKVEKPYVVQLFGANPEHFAKAVKIVEKKIKPDGFDINFGCPVPKVAKQGAGAALAQNLKLSREVIQGVINNTSLPVSVKLRAKSGSVDCLEFLNFMKDLDIKAVMIHGRTLAQGFSGAINTEIICQARNYFGGIILANGGLESALDAPEILRKTQADGLGVARAALGRPWIFTELKKGEIINKLPKEIFAIALEHARLAEIAKGKQGIVEMRKHLCWYTQGLPGARKLRGELVQTSSLKDIKDIFKKFA